MAAPKQAAVLLPFCNRNGVPSVLFTLRSDKVGEYHLKSASSEFEADFSLLSIYFTLFTRDAGTHKGQVSFPGGHIDPGESARDAALREFREEMWAHSYMAGTAHLPNVTVVGQARPLPAVTKTIVRFIGAVFAHFSLSAY